MEKLNKYGLSRYVPADIKRQIRQVSGFGCVICGLGIYEYEHVDPEFYEAEEHDPNKMTLLCHQCHGKVTRGQLSKQTVKEAMDSPFCKRAGYSREFFDIGKGHPFIQIGGVRLQKTRIPIQVGSTPLIKFDTPDELGMPFKFSGIFCDSNGNNSLQIVDNEWIAQTSNWDIDITGTSIVIKEAAGHTHLQLDVVPPDGIVVTKLDMAFAGYKFLASGDSLNVILPNGGFLDLESCLFEGAYVGFSFG